MMAGGKQQTINNKQPAFADVLACLNALRLQEPCLLFIDDCSLRRNGVER